MTVVRPRTKLAVSSKRSHVAIHNQVSQLRSVLQGPAGQLKPHCYSNQVNQRKLTMVFMSQIGTEKKPHQLAPPSMVCSIRSDDNNKS
jgi:hypothetical protein